MTLQTFIPRLTTPITTLNRVGKTTAAQLKRLGITTIYDLLFYFPFRYEDFRQIVPIAQAVAGQTLTIEGTIELIANRRSARRRTTLTEALVSDPSGSLRVVWFNQPFLTKNLHPGETIFLSGTIKKDLLGPQLVGPAYEKKSLEATTHTARLVPMYPLTAGLTEKQLRYLVAAALPAARMIIDWLPDKICSTYALVGLAPAIIGIHFPVDEVAMQKSTERLKFDELFLIQLQAELQRRQKKLTAAPAINFHGPEIKSFVQQLNFALTKTQKIAAWEILQDLSRPEPMNRLLSGDVGSGKTVVAAMAVYNTVLNSYQAVVMAPTEILAEQHFESLKKLLTGTGITIGLLTANQRIINYSDKLPASVEEIFTNTLIEKKLQLEIKNSNDAFQKKVAEKKNEILSKNVAEKKNEVLSKIDFYKKISTSELQIIIGTHALLTEGVTFSRLGLVVVDEQHRFGVEQRKVIKDKGQGVHFLSMTATPIPRSLALLLYGDLDLSIISELPPGRKTIMTRLIEPHQREQAYAFIREQVRQGRQVFVVCPLIQNVTGENIEKKSVLSEYERLSKKIFLGLRVGYLHGNMPARKKINKTTAKIKAVHTPKGDKFNSQEEVAVKSKEEATVNNKKEVTVKSKEEVMDDFKNGRIDILVSTSVIEVGVDVPNASVMMIEDADRFGLAQLHQFRGRVGRSAHQSYCMLFTNNTSHKVVERLRYFESHHDGFKLAEKDLEIRGPGEVYGTEQSGMMRLRLATMMDRELIQKSRRAAAEVASEIDKYPQLLQRVKEWQAVVHLE